MLIRRAGPGDAQTLSRIASRTFTDTFGHLYPPQDLQAFLSGSYSLEACERVLADDACAVWLLEDGGVAVGPDDDVGLTDQRRSGKLMVSEQAVGCLEPLRTGRAVGVEVLRVDVEAVARPVGPGDPEAAVRRRCDR